MTLDTQLQENGVDHSTPEQSQLARVLDAYLADIEAGRAINPEDLITAHPHLADRLRACLSVLQLAGQVEAPKATNTPLEPSLNSRLGDFQILRIAGRGGMGIVFEAEQLSLHRRVALKILPFAAALDPLQLRRFQIEAQAAAQLHHTNIVPIFSVGSEQGVHYYAMQYIEGQTLATLISDLQGRATHSFRYRERPASESIQNNELQAGPSDAPPCKGGVGGGSDDRPGSYAGLSHAPPCKGGVGGGSDDRPGSHAGLSHAPPCKGGVGGGSDECHCLSIPPNLPRNLNVLDKARVGGGSSPPSIQTITPTTSPTIHTAAHFNTVARLGQQAAEALHHAHQLGVIHRDIKPSNLLIDTRGTLWITDFGLARIQSDSTLTMTGDIIGTLRYMSPEQSSGGHSPVDHRADIYSLGATLYELLTLHPVHHSPDRAALIRQMTVEDPIPPRKHNPAIPKDLETIILKMLEKDAGHRYPTAKELSEDLNRFLQRRPIAARRPSVRDRTAKWMRRHPSLTGSALVILAFAVVSLLATLFIVDRERSQTVEKSRQVEELTQSLERELYVSRVNQSYADYLNGNASRIIAILDECPAHLRNWEWRFVRHLCQQDRYVTNPSESFKSVNHLPVKFIGDGSRWLSASGNSGVWDQPGHLRISDSLTGSTLQDLSHGPMAGVRSIAISPDGQLIAVGLVGPTGSVELRESRSGTMIAKLAMKNSWTCAGLDFSPDGRHLVVLDTDHDDHRTALWNVATKSLIRKDEPRKGAGRAIAFHPNNSVAIVTGGDPDVSLRNPAIGTIERAFHGHNGTAYRIAIASDGKRLATSGFDQTIRIWDIANAKLIHYIQHPLGFADEIAWSPIGDKIAAATPRAITIWNAVNAQEIATIPATTSFGAGIAFSPDGQTLLASSKDGTVRLWKTSTLAPRILHHGDWVNHVVFSDDGKKLLTTDAAKQCTLWDIPSGTALTKYQGHIDSVSTAEFLPNLHAVISASWDASLRLWNLDDGEPRRQLLPISGYQDRHQGNTGNSLNDLVVDPTRSVVAVAGWDWTVRVFDCPSFTERLRYRGHQGIVWSLCASPDGRSIASAAADGTVRLWSLQTGEDTWVRKIDIPKASTTQRKILAFSPNGLHLAVCVGTGDGGLSEIQIRSAASGQLLQTMPHPGGQLNAIAFAPDGTRMASASENNTVTIWDTKTGKSVLVLRGHTAPVLSLTFSPDGQQIASGSIDKTVRIWDAPHATNDAAITHPVHNTAQHE